MPPPALITSLPLPNRSSATLTRGAKLLQSSDKATRPASGAYRFKSAGLYVEDAECIVFAPITPK